MSVWMKTGVNLKGSYLKQTTTHRTTVRLGTERATATTNTLSVFPHIFHLGGTPNGNRLRSLSTVVLKVRVELFNDEPKLRLLMSLWGSVHGPGFIQSLHHDCSPTLQSLISV
ncbi:hypothetical protein DPEC_G00336750 [Dallia pectoralis]|uniref:Uncharacterized protein n=1 Tax=Dallia pectoralis TaxID=75939 RepID=A0ACC2F772_DALPE|nr:hypothetical protein DPEC_G00336750 [Dallia pectoralis]